MYNGKMEDLSAFMENGTEVRITTKDGTEATGKIAYIDKWAVHLRNEARHIPSIVPFSDFDKIEAIQPKQAE